MAKGKRRSGRKTTSSVRLPLAQAVEVAAQSTVTIATASLVGSKTVKVSDIGQEFSPSVSATGQPRAIMLKSIDCMLGPEVALTQGQAVTVQIVATTPEGFLVPLTRQKQLSAVNPTSIRCRVPVWLLRPSNVGSSVPLFDVVLTSSLAASAPGFTVPFSLKCQVDVSPSVPNNF